MYSILVLCFHLYLCYPYFQFAVNPLTTYFHFAKPKFVFGEFICMTPGNGILAVSVLEMREGRVPAPPTASDSDCQNPVSRRK